MSNYRGKHVEAQIKKKKNWGGGGIDKLPYDSKKIPFPSKYSKVKAAIQRFANQCSQPHSQQSKGGQPPSAHR